MLVFQKQTNIMNKLIDSIYDVEDSLIRTTISLNNICFYLGRLKTSMDTLSDDERKAILYGIQYYQSKKNKNITG